MRKHYDFSGGRRGPVVPVKPGKTRITIRLDDDVLEFFRERVEVAGGGSYQALINDALRAPCDDPSCLPQWDLGLNLALPDLGSEPPGWFRDVEQVARIAGRLVGRTGRHFVIGIGDSTTGVSEDLFEVETEIPDLAALRAIIGVGPPVT